MPVAVEGCWSHWHCTKGSGEGCRGHGTVRRGGHTGHEAVKAIKAKRARPSRARGEQPPSYGRRTRLRGRKRQCGWGLWRRTLLDTFIHQELGAVAPSPAPPLLLVPGEWKTGLGWEVLQAHGSPIPRGE